MSDLDIQKTLFMQGIDSFNNQRYYDAHEFWEELWKEMESWDTGNLKPNELKVLEAIKLLLEHPDSIEIFNKKAIYLYLREITGLNTKQIVNNLNKMRARYRVFKKKYNGGDQ